MTALFLFMEENTTEETANYEHIDTCVKCAICGDHKAFEELLYCYRNLLDSIAKRYYRPCRCQLCEFRDDLKGKFYMFLLEYKFERKVFFSTYISRRLNWYAYNCLTEQREYETTTKPIDLLSIKELSTLSEPGLVDTSLCCDEVLEYVRKGFSELDYKLFCGYYYEGVPIKELSSKFVISKTNIWGRLNTIKEEIKKYWENSPSC